MVHLRVNVGHIRVAVGHPRVTIGHLRVTLGMLLLLYFWQEAKEKQPTFQQQMDADVAVSEAFSLLFLLLLEVVATIKESNAITNATIST